MMISSPSYNGADRRHAQRRLSVDRRSMIRFEPERDPRRSGSDRRQNGYDQWDKRDL